MPLEVLRWRCGVNELYLREVRNSSFELFLQQTKGFAPTYRSGLIGSKIITSILYGTYTANVKSVFVILFVHSLDTATEECIGMISGIWCPLVVVVSFPP